MLQKACSWLMLERDDRTARGHVFGVIGGATTRNLVRYVPLRTKNILTVRSDQDGEKECALMTR